MNEKEQLPMTEKENVRWRVANAHIDPDNYVFYATGEDLSQNGGIRY